MRNIFVQYLQWHFLEHSKLILKAWKNLLLFNLNYFSIPLLVKTLFSPWRRYRWSYGKGFDVKRYLSAFLSNTISRVLGAIIRIALIIVGVLVEAFLVLAGLAVFVAWIFLPLILILGLWFGLGILF